MNVKVPNFNLISISYRTFLFNTEIFCSSQILQLLRPFLQTILCIKHKASSGLCHKTVFGCNNTTTIFVMTLLKIKILIILNLGDVTHNWL